MHGLALRSYAATSTWREDKDFPDIRLMTKVNRIVARYNVTVVQIVVMGDWPTELDTVMKVFGLNLRRDLLFSDI